VDLEAGLRAAVARVPADVVLALIGGELSFCRCGPSIGTLGSFSAASMPPRSAISRAIGAGYPTPSVAKRMNVSML
jgi:hypothetical protein